MSFTTILGFLFVILGIVIYGYYTPQPTYQQRLKEKEIPQDPFETINE